MKPSLSILFLLCTLSAQAWDFCQKNADGIMIYYNRIADDEEACEVAYAKDADYCYPVIRVPSEVLLAVDPELGYPDTMLTVIGLGKSAFYRGMMQKIELPPTIGYIESSAFSHCESLESIEWPEGNDWLYYIGPMAFSQTNSLDYFKIPKSVEELSESAFAYSGMTTVEFEEGNKYITSIPNRCFYNSAIVNIKIPSFIKEIGEYAFAECKGMNPPYLSVGVKIIGSYAFYNHKKWNQFELPETITDIGDYAFCARITDSGGEKPSRDLLNISTLYVNAKKPPYCLSKKALGDDTYDVDKKIYTPEITNLNFVIPEKTPKDYQAIYPWTRIAIPCYHTRDTSGIPTVTAGSQDEEESIFSLDGKQLDFRQKGINIVRYKDGTVRKVLQR